MRVRNMRKFDLYYPYAGLHKGAVIKPGELSVDLPTERFYDKLLQRDWKRGNIEVELSQMDEAILGPEIADMFNVSKAPAAPVAQPVRIVKTAADANPLPKPVEPVVVKEAEPVHTPPAMGPVIPAAPVVPVVEPQQVIKDAVAKSSVEPVSTTGPKVCKLCPRTESVSFDERANLEICRHCKVKLTKGTYQIADGRLVYTGKMAKLETANPSNIQPQSPTPVIPKPTVGKVDTPQMHQPEVQVPGAPVPRQANDIAALSTYNRGIPFGPARDLSAVGHDLGQPKFGSAAVGAKKDGATKPDILQGPLGSPLTTMTKLPKPKARIEG